MSTDSLTRIAIHLHLYYQNMWPQIKHNLASINNATCDLFVTLTEENQELKKEILAFHPNSQIWIVANRGYDVGPFIDFLHHIDLDKYDLILKLHTKSQTKAVALVINGLILDKKLWKDFLFQGLLATPKLFNNIITQFKLDPKLGMVGAKRLITTKEKTSEISRPLVNKIMKKLGFSTPKEIKFIAGTMFMCRTQILKPIKNNYSLTDFEKTKGSSTDGTLAHALERVFGTLTIALGYNIKGFDRNYSLLFRAYLKKFWHFVYQNKFTHNHYHLIKICKLPIYRKTHIRKRDA